MITSKEFYRGDLRGVISSFDDSRVVSDCFAVPLSDECLAPYARSLACARSYARLMKANHRALTHVSIGANFYANDDSDYDSDDKFERGSVEHPFFPIALSAAAQLQSVRVRDLSLENLGELLGALDHDIVHELSIRTGYNGWCSAPVAAFLQKKTHKLETFEFITSDFNDCLPVLNALLVAGAHSLQSLRIGVSSYGIDEYHKLQAQKLADPVQAICGLYRASIKVVGLHGPCEGSSLYKAFLKPFDEKNFKPEMYEELNKISLEKYAVPLSHLLWYDHTFFWPIVEASANPNTADWENERRCGIVTALAKHCLDNPTEHTIKAIRNDLSYLVHRLWTFCWLDDTAKAIMQTHLQKTAALGLYSADHDVDSLVKTIRKFYPVRAVEKPGLAALHRIVICNPDTLKEVMSVRAASLLDYDSALPPSARPHLFRVNEWKIEGEHLAYFLINYPEGLKALVAHARFNPALVPPNRGGPFIGQLIHWSLVAEIDDNNSMAVVKKRNRDDIRHAAASVIRRTRGATYLLDFLYADIPKLLLVFKDAEFRDAMGFAAGEQWPDFLPYDVVQAVVQAKEVNLLHDFLASVAKGQFGLGKVSHTQQEQLADHLWGYLIECVDSVETFNYLGKHLVEAFPFIPGWVNTFIRSGKLSEVNCKIGTAKARQLLSVIPRRK